MPGDERGLDDECYLSCACDCSCRSQQKLRTSRGRPGATPRGTAPGGAPDRRSTAQTAQDSKHVSSGPHSDSGHAAALGTSA